MSIKSPSCKHNRFSVILEYMEETSTTEEHQSAIYAKTPIRSPKRWLAIPAAIVASAAIIASAYVGYLYAATPLDIRQPLYEHYHFRMSLTVGGKELNFAEAKFQEGYSKDNCNAALTTHPIHFHDNKNHFVHIHWEGMTGGQVLKYYGWDMIGGTHGSMGYRFDEGIIPKKVPAHGNVLPAVPNDGNFYVYTGNTDKYSRRDFQDFTSRDLEKFFGKESNSPAHKLNQQKRSSLVDSLVPRAHAHGTAEDHAAEGLSDSERLEQLNNLVGDVVIFVQQDPPNDQQIKQRFQNLTPLGESTCAG